MEHVLLAHVRSNALTENDGHTLTGEPHRRDNRRNVLGELAMDYVDAMAFDKSAELPDDPGMEIPADIQRNCVDIVQMSLLCKAASTVACKPHAMVSLLQLTGDFKRLNFKSAPRVGEAGLKYVECLMKRHW